MSTSYEEFLQTKRAVANASGFEVDKSDINPMLFPFQIDIVQWACRRGRAAIFADCGMGKTPMQLEWAKLVCEYTSGRVLIVAPLAVTIQTTEEGKKFGVNVTICKSAKDIRDGINITNYDRLHLFSPEGFAGIVLDESSILKGFDGVTRKQITDFARLIDYRLACTATPAPNDLLELTNHAEFLDIMSGKEVIALFFTQDGNTTHAFRLKGHAKQDFWIWLSSWCVAIRKPSDLGYDDGDFVLPKLKMHSITVDVDPDQIEALFAVEALTMQERRSARRASMDDRVRITADLVNDSTEQWVVWCDLNVESELLSKYIPDAVEVQGKDTSDHKERAALDFQSGKIRVIVSKPSIFGFGMNWQICKNVAFVGLSDSYEKFYQAVRRCWRFGQKNDVDCYVITSLQEGAIVKNIERKEANAKDMMDSLISHTEGLSPGKSTRDDMAYETREDAGKSWKMLLGDCIERIDDIPDNSVGLAIFSPPFPGMYAYTNSARDIGNTKNIEQMIAQFRYLLGEDKLLRIVKPGRSCCIHLTQTVAFKGVDGYIGIKDFRGKVIEQMENAGWIYYGEVCIDKNPQLKAIRTKDQGLLFKTLATDSSKMHMALADYLLQFRKPGDNTEPIRAGISEKYSNEDGWITQEEWIEWAAPVWYRKTPHYPGGISETDVLNVSQARETDDERHLCPLQLGVIERAVKLWSNPGDVVFSPFAGIGSEGVGALKCGRNFTGIELKQSYYNQAVRNLTNHENKTHSFNLLDYEDNLDDTITEDIDEEVRI